MTTSDVHGLLPSPQNEVRLVVWALRHCRSAPSKRILSSLRLDESAGAGLRSNANFTHLVADLTKREKAVPDTDF